jgi:hypothetical protein
MSKKYHKEHPTISFRCSSIEEYNLIKRMVEISGKSESKFIHEILLKEEIKESNSYNTGYNDGINKIILPCPDCGLDMIFDVKNVEEYRQKIISSFGDYAHVNCIKKRKQIRF